MGLNFKELILRTQGDGSDARRDLAQTGAALRDLDQTEAEAVATLDTTELRRKLTETKRQLADLSRVEATPEVNLATAAAQARIRALEARLAILAGRDYDVDVDVSRGKAERATSLLSGITRAAQTAVTWIGDRLGGAFGSLGSAIGPGSSFASSSSSATGGLGALAFAGGEAAAAIGVVLFAAIGAAVTAVYLLVSSLAAAALGLGAVGFAALALVFGPLAVLGGAMKIFSDDADKAGTAANALKETFKSFFSIIRPAANALFSGINAGLRPFLRSLREIRPALTQLGKAMGRSFGAILKELASPKWQAFFRFLFKMTAQAAGPLTKAFINFMRIMRDITRAAMPFLIEGLKGLARWLKSISQSTKDTKGLRSSIGGLLEHLSAWWSLAKGIFRIFTALFSAGAKDGKGLVRSLADGANALADWLQSSEGIKRVKEFLADVKPLISEVAKFFGALLLIGLELFQAMAPALTFIFQALNLIAKPIIALLELFNKIPGSIRSWLVPISFAGSSIATLVGIAASIGPAIKDAWGAVKKWTTEKVTAAWDWVTNAYRNARDWIVKAAKNVWEFLKRFTIKPVSAAFNWLKNAFRTAGNWIKRAVSDVWNKIKDFTTRPAGKAFEWIVGALKWAVNAGIGILNTLIDAFNKVFDREIDPPIGPTFHGIHIDPIPTLARGVRSFVGGLAVVGEAGPELVDLPAGSRVFSNRKSRELAGGGDIYQIDVSAPDGELPDPEAVAALLSMKIRARGGLA